MMQYNEWAERQIGEHEKEMVELFCENLVSTFSPEKDLPLALRWFREFQAGDKNLLVRALLCFGDFSKHSSGDTYSLFDFEYIRQHECFEKFSQFVAERQPATLQQVIDHKLNSEELKDDHRYLFIKYPAVIDYCKNGLFQWKETAANPMVYLLESDRNTKRQAKELYTYLLQLHLERQLNNSLCSDNQGLYINIRYKETEYEITDDKNSDFQLQIWNDDGMAISHCMVASVNGNHTSAKQLQDYKWQKTGRKTFERFGRSRLLPLAESWHDNLLHLFDETEKLLKNGFGIRSPSI
jgi:hypothetical protein